MRMNADEYFKKITPSEDMLAELMKMRMDELKSVLRRIYKFIFIDCSEAEAEAEDNMRWFRSKNECRQEILEFVTSGKHRDYWQDKENGVAPVCLRCSSLAELDLKLSALGF